MNKIQIIPGKTYTKEEVLLLDRQSRGRTYMNQRSKNRVFVHCVVQDIETKKVSVIYSNCYTQEMNSMLLDSFYGNVAIEGKQVKRFIEEEKPSNLGLQLPTRQPMPVQRLHDYEKKEEQQKFELRKKGE